MSERKRGILTSRERKLLAYIHELKRPVSLKEICSVFDLSYRQSGYVFVKLLDQGYLKRENKVPLLVDITNKSISYLREILGNLDVLQKQRVVCSTHQNCKTQIQKKDTKIKHLDFLSRSHRVTIEQPIIQRGNIPTDFHKRPADKLNWKHDIYFKKLDNLRIEIKLHSIYYFFTNVFSIDPNHLTSVCINHCFRYAQTLRAEGWKLDLPKTAVISQEHAVFSQELSDFTRKFKIFYKNDRVAFDSSIKPNEFELISPNYSAEDFTRWIEFQEAVAIGKINLKKLLDLQKSLSNDNNVNNKTNGGM